MVRKNGLAVLLVLLVGLGLTVIGCSQSDTSKTSGTSGSTDMARSASPNAPGQTGMPGSNPPPAAPPLSAGAPAAPSPSAATAPQEATGKVISADAGKRTLIVKSGAGEMMFEVKDEAASDLQGIKPGDNVTVQYTENAGKFSAEAVRKG